MKSPSNKEVTIVYDIEVYADAYELEQAYRLEFAAEEALEHAAGDAVLDDLEQRVNALLERQASNSRRSKP